MKLGIIMRSNMAKDGKNKETLYSLLGLSGEESTKFITAKYNKFLQEHADRNLAGDEKTISLAYEILVDSTTRALYDAANPREEIKVTPNFDISKVKLRPRGTENNPAIVNIAPPVNTPPVKNQIKPLQGTARR
jgi:hypothetical protein